jgi:prevent-host-death family protein
MSTGRWNVAEAKAKLSAMLQSAAREPQVIENRGKEVAVVLGIEEYRRFKALEERSSPRAKMDEFLRLTAELRREGGVTIKLPKRRPRRSPFTPERDY